ncbi:7192_t:CDS:10 [Acaulospora colombiana]|uniref:7192_t:CDS:1 n=1 Tax=Acaulospora colombiana TaxID=27376 RepID=A0ACA9KF40_9GLOM|nr:7192_t:CDS:10 [Acaulospora colombiana]
MIQRELWVFWLGEQGDHPSILSSLHQLEDSACGGVFSWEDFESSTIQYRLFIKSIKNLIDSDLESLDNAQAILVPSGSRAKLLSTRRYSDEEASIILNEFKTFFDIDAMRRSETDSTYLPPLVQVSITHETITKEFPYPSQCIYIVTEGNISYHRGIPDFGMGPVLWENLGDGFTNSVSLKERHLVNNKLNNIDWWNYSDPLREIMNMQRNFQDLNASSPTGPETTMTPNTPGIINGPSSANSPGHPLTPASRSKKRPMETKAYPSPPDVIQPLSTEVTMSPAISEGLIPMADDMIGIIETDYETQDYDFNELMTEEVTEDDFKNFDNASSEPSHTHIPTSLNYLTPAPEPPSSLVTESTSTQAMSPPKKMKSYINISLEYECDRDPNPLIPEDYVPLKFSNHVDEKKYLPGGKFYQPPSRKKRKRGKMVYLYGPDGPSQFDGSKKHKGTKKTTTKEDIVVPKEDSDEFGSEIEDSDYSSDSGSSMSAESDYESDVTEGVNSRKLEFINAGRLTMVFDLHDLHGRRQLRTVSESESKDPSTEAALKCLREQIVLGSYPFGVGINGEGESTHELLESHRCLVENLSSGLPTASVLPFEMGKVIADCKSALDDISKKLPRSQDHSELSVNGPLTVQNYYNLGGCQLFSPSNQEMRDDDGEPVFNFQEFSTPDIIASANELLIETSPEIIKFWDTHKLTPYDGAKNVRYLVLYPESDHLRNYVEYFVDELRVQYEHLCALGTHEPVTSSGYNRGLVPIPLKAPSPNESSLARQIHSYEIACEKLDMQGKHIGSDTLLTTNPMRQAIHKKILFTEAWNKTLTFSQEVMGGCRKTMITKLGVMTKEERDLWMEITGKKIPILAIDVESSLSIDPTIKVANPKKFKVCGMVLNDPIPLYDYRPLVTGYLLEMDTAETVSSAFQVDLLHYPEEGDKSIPSAMWEILKKFHTLTFMEVTPIRTCLPLHVLSVERLARAFVGAPT